MTLFQISYKNIKAKPLSSLLNLVLFGTGIFIISFLLLLKTQFEDHMEKNIAGVDLVVGAKGSPMQLILCTLYHVDYPTGNIKLAEANKLKGSPLVKKTIPMALSDNYMGYRIVGTNHDYATLYHGKLEKGSLWEKDFDVSIGSRVAEEAGLKIGDQFVGVHGFMANGTDKHKEFKYTVTGIFKETGTVLDQLILTNIGSVWKIHEHHHHEEQEAAKHGFYNAGNLKGPQTAKADTAKEITSLLVFYRNPMGALTLPRMINKDTNMQAASPAAEMNRLYSLLGVGIRSASLIAYFIILISAFSIFISLFHSMKERKYELAILRVLGGGKINLFAIVIFEGLLIAISGFVLGFVLSRLAMLFISHYAESNFHYSLNTLFNGIDDFYLFIAALVVGFLSSVLPAIKAMKTDISKTLSE